MGGSWRINLFFGVSPDSVYACYKRLHPNLVENREDLIEKPTGWLRFWAARHREAELQALCPDDTRMSMYYQTERSIVCVMPDGGCGNLGWGDLSPLQRAHRYISSELGCPSILCLMCDGDYWGYELFDGGQAVDHFLQWPDEAETWFPGEDCSGNPEQFERLFEHLSAADVAPYFVHCPVLSGDLAGLEEYIECDRRFEELDVKVRPDDVSTRLDAHALFDFLDLLGLRIHAAPAPAWFSSMSLVRQFYVPEERSRGFRGM